MNTADPMPPRLKSSDPIQIAGAGPSGLAAAIHLAKRGVPVDVFEARKTVGGRFIGDFQVIENIGAGGGVVEDAPDLLARLGISVNFFFRPVQRAVFFGSDRKPRPVSSARPFAWFVRRGAEGDTLDVGLAAQAQAAGATIRYNTRLPRDRADVLATGPGVPDGLARQIVFSTPLPETVWVLFDTTCAPGGYAYLFVIDGCATLGCAITRDFDRIDLYFDRARRRFQEIAPFSVADARSGYSYMSFSLKRSATVDRRLFVGEAGGFQDFLFGLGLRYALTTGHLAARSLIEDESYDALWRTALGAAQERSLVHRALYEWGGDFGFSAMLRRATRGDVQEVLSRHQAPRFWKHLLLPWIKWRWRNRSRCTHPFSDHWCRRRPKAIGSAVNRHSSVQLEIGETSP